MTWCVALSALNAAFATSPAAWSPRCAPELDFCGKFLSTEKFSTRVSTRAHRIWTIVENWPKKISLRALIPPLFLYSSSVKPKNDFEKLHDRRGYKSSEVGDFLGPIFHKSQFCAHRVTTWSGMENFSVDKNFPQKSSFSPRRGASRYRLQRHAFATSPAAWSPDAQNWTFVESFIDQKNFSAVPWSTRYIWGLFVVKNLAPSR